MATTDKLFAGPIPELYERLLVPLIFESYARDLARRVAATKPQDVLETAAGTGVLTRAMASCLPPAARIVATDLNQPMLDQAAKRQAGDRRIAWRQADALALPFPPASFDVVACQFGAMFFPDKVAASAKRGGCCDPAVISCSMCGTGFQKTNSPTWSRKRWRRFFPMIRRASWRALHMVITMWSKSGAT
jgi:SAM-dependent methyltransferase